ncbi:carbohydrate ABC transporter permease [Paenibacillus piri]|uniref:Carbohydrate ABC transporter permease n=1 Tax=Paenibacillus piri TaxID=2547395 RepID=A0A4R5KL83_9BACL|nr:carbohydrate ABC transporter permease [Paenibacillus piri]TDF95942.1 carbohydrate ABC transporter permease [Paenibacillus piri]
MYKKTWGEKVFDGSNYILLCLLVVVTLYPFIYVLMASLSDPKFVAQYRGLLLWPHGFTLNTYTFVFENPMIATGYRNTLFYVFAGTVINMLLTALGAYALSRRYLIGGTTIMILIVFTMFFSGGLIPTYLNVRNLGLLDSAWAIILPSAVNTFNLIVMRTAFRAVPESMEESAKIDGANDYTILFRIFIPLSLPVMAVILLFYLVQHWNSWFPALIYLRTRELFPIQLILREILIASSTDTMTAGNVAQLDQMPVGETIKYATIIIVTLPIVCVYPFLQKYFAKGIMVGAVKE